MRVPASGCSGLLEQAAAFVRGALDVDEVLAAEQQRDHRRHRRVVKRAAELDLRFVERLVVVAERVLDRVVRRERGLDHHLPAQLPAARAAGDLGEEIERLLRGAEVGIAEDRVGVEDAGEGDVREVMSLAEHLRPDERARLAAAEAVEDLHEPSPCAAWNRDRARRRGRRGNRDGSAPRLSPCRSRSAAAPRPGRAGTSSGCACAFRSSGRSAVLRGDARSA